MKRSIFIYFVSAIFYGTGCSPYYGYRSYSPEPSKINLHLVSDRSSVSPDSTHVEFRLAAKNEGPKKVRLPGFKEITFIGHPETHWRIKIIHGDSQRVYPGSVQFATPHATLLKLRDLVLPPGDSCELAFALDFRKINREVFPDVPLDVKAGTYKFVASYCSLGTKNCFAESNPVEITYSEN